MKKHHKKNRRHDAPPETTPIAATPDDSSDDLAAVGYGRERDVEESVNSLPETEQDMAAPAQDGMTEERDFAAVVSRFEPVPPLGETNVEEGDVEPEEQAEDPSGTPDRVSVETDLRAIIEALVFASDEPITFKQVRSILEEGAEMDDAGDGDAADAADTADASDGANEEKPGARRSKRGITLNRFRGCIDALNAEYARDGRVFRIVEVAGGHVFQTTADYGYFVGKLYAERTKRRLSQSALETLAIIAFKQPISKPSIEAIRGVNADYVLKSLLEKSLIAIVGREDTVGRPLLYGTTKAFLTHFGLPSLDDLPKMREIQEMFHEEESAITHTIDEGLEPTEDDFIAMKLNSIFDTLKRPDVATGDTAADAAEETAADAAEETNDDTTDEPVANATDEPVTDTADDTVTKVTDETTDEAMDEPVADVHAVSDETQGERDDAEKH